MAKANSTVATAADSIATESEAIEALLDDLPYSELDSSSSDTQAEIVIASVLIAHVRERIERAVERECERLYGRPECEPCAGTGIADDPQAHTGEAAA